MQKQLKSKRVKKRSKINSPPATINRRETFLFPRGAEGGYQSQVGVIRSTYPCWCCKASRANMHEPGATFTPRTHEDFVQAINKSTVCVRLEALEKQQVIDGLRQDWRKRNGMHGWVWAPVYPINDWRLQAHELEVGAPTDTLRSCSVT